MRKAQRRIADEVHVLKYILNIKTIGALFLQKAANISYKQHI